MTAYYNPQSRKPWYTPPNPTFNIISWFFHYTSIRMACVSLHVLSITMMVTSYLPLLHLTVFVTIPNTVCGDAPILSEHWCVPLTCFPLPRWGQWLIRHHKLHISHLCRTPVNNWHKVCWCSLPTNTVSVTLPLNPGNICYFPIGPQ